MSAIAHGISEAVRAGREVARYRVCGGERLVLAEPVEGGQRLVDVAAEGGGEALTVDSCWRDASRLTAFLRDYVEVGEDVGCSPVLPGLIEGDVEVLESQYEAVLDLYWRIGAS